MTRCKVRTNGDELAHFSPVPFCAKGKDVSANEEAQNPRLLPGAATFMYSNGYERSRLS